MRHALSLLIGHSYFVKLMSEFNKMFTDIEVVGEGPDAGTISYVVGAKTHTIKPVTDPMKELLNINAGLLIAAGYIVITSEGVDVVKNSNGEIYQIHMNSCSCPDRNHDCKHKMFVTWYKQFRLDQVELLKELRD